MASWYGSSRSNYFRVKDPAAFRKAMDAIGVKVWSEGHELSENDTPDTMFAIAPDEMSDGDWPSMMETTDDGDYVDLEPIEYLIAPHLADGQVAILMTIGAEKLRYLTGVAIAVTNVGDTVEVEQVTLDDIYERVLARWGVTPTPASY